MLPIQKVGKILMLFLFSRQEWLEIFFPIFSVIMKEKSNVKLWTFRLQLNCEGGWDKCYSPRAQTKLEARAQWAIPISQILLLFTKILRSFITFMHNWIQKATQKIIHTWMNRAFFSFSFFLWVMLASVWVMINNLF